MPYCPLCDIKFKSKNGLQGHFRFKHKIETKSGRPATETAMTKAIGKQIERMRSGDALIRELEEKKWSEEKDSGMSGEEAEYVPKKSFEGLRKALEREPQNRLKGFEELKKGLKRWK